MTQFRIVFSILLVVSLDSTGYCESISKGPNEKSQDSHHQGIHSQPKKISIFSPIYDIKPNKDNEFSHLDSKRFSGLTWNNNGLRDKYPNAYPTREMHPGSQQMMDMDTANRLINQQMIQNNMSNFQNSIQWHGVLDKWLSAYWAGNPPLAEPSIFLINSLFVCSFLPGDAF